jgi:two-component system, chemotaxis family, CheB/CheR fusion protein
MTPTDDLPDSLDDPDSHTAAGRFPDDELDAILEFVRDARGFDFTGYKRTSIARRVERRVSDLGLDSLSAYLDLLEADVDEFTQLFNTILINLTGFFRDPDAWKYLGDEIIPQIAAGRAGDEPIRVWSAGCASGEEVYTLAMVIAEYLGVAELDSRLKIYGTDVDVDALSQARNARYSDSALVAVPEPLQQRYFQADERETGFVVVPALRRAAVFGRHDITRDPPISRVDLLVCRNTLMYLSAETQRSVIPRLHYALNNGGYLFLGRAETIVHGGAARFTPVSLAHRVFAAIPTEPRTSPAPSGQPEGELFRVAPLQPSTATDRRWTTMRDAAFETGVVAQIIVGTDGTLLGANEAARDRLGINLDQLGQPLGNLRVSFDPVELRAPIERAVVEQTSQMLGVVHRTLRDGRVTDLDVHVLPLFNAAGGILGVSVTFTDVSNVTELRDEFRRMHEALETAYEELQSTNEELVTSNEELQSTNEELETSNEELQSTNEELETTNDELRDAQGTVERINQTLIQLNQELNRHVGEHQRLLDGLHAAVLVLNPQLLIEEWNAAAADLWGLRREEAVGQPLFGLDIGLPLEPLHDPVRACLANGASQTIDIEAVNRWGRHFPCRVSVQLLVNVQPEGDQEAKALLLMYDRDRVRL